MKVKSMLKVIIVLMCLLILPNDVVNGKTTTLWRHSSYTYVTSYHPANYFSDYYKGIASVRGLDRIARGNRYYGMAWTRITYDIQGNVSSKTAKSTSNSDKTRRQVVLEAYDKWNVGSKTKALYNYGTRDLPDGGGNQPVPTKLNEL